MRRTPPEIIAEIERRLLAGATTHAAVKDLAACQFTAVSVRRGLVLAGKLAPARKGPKPGSKRRAYGQAPRAIIFAPRAAPPLPVAAIIEDTFIRPPTRAQLMGRR